MMCAGTAGRCVCMDLCMDTVYSVYTYICTIVQLYINDQICSRFSFKRIKKEHRTEQQIDCFSKFICPVDYIYFLYKYKFYTVNRMCRLIKQFSVFQLLLERGANSDARTFHGETPLGTYKMIFPSITPITLGLRLGNI